MGRVKIHVRTMVREPSDSAKPKSLIKPVESGGKT